MENRMVFTRPAVKRVVCLYVDNQPNVLARIASLMGRRNFNISTITASETHIPGITRITIVVMSEDEDVLNQIVAQTEKLEPVRSAYVLDTANTVYRELLMVKIKADESNRTSLREIVDIYRGKIIDLSRKSLVIELTGTPEKIDGFVKMIEAYEIIEFCRTGVTGIERGLTEDPLAF